MDKNMQKPNKTIVVVHGAWTGAWSWERVASRLHARGYRTFIPTLTGLGERAHLAGPDVNLDTHIRDIVNEIEYKDLRDIVLVAHSYGGIVACGAMEHLAGRIASVVFVEAFIPEDNTSFSDLDPDSDFSAALIAPPPSSRGDYLREEDRAWADTKATAQPSGTFTQKVRVNGAYETIPRKTFVVATGWNGPFGEIAKQHATGESWTVRELACGHDIPIDMPDELTGLLIEAAG